MSDYLEGFSTQVSGVTRHGKSYWVKKKFIPLLVQFKPVIIFDYKGEYAGPRAKDAYPSWNYYENIYEFGDELVKVGGFKQEVHVIRCWDDKDYNIGLSVLEHEKAQVSIILDEAQFIFDDSDLSVAAKKLKTLVRAGAGEGVDVIFVAQSVMDIHPKIRGQFIRRITFRLNHSSDIEVMKKDNGFPDAEKALDLDKREYLIFGKFPDHIHGKIKQLKE